MKILHFDCFSGISGDMVLGAFLDLGVEVSYLSAELSKLGVPGFRIEEEKTMRHGISGTRCHVILEENDTIHHRHFSDIKTIIEASTLSDAVKETALAIFRRVAVAEAKVHNVPLDHVHFHEVGALDSIVDIVGAAICYHKVAPAVTYGSKINVGKGFVKCAHGLLPVPAPATAEILCDSGFEIYSKDIDGESATPTGVAILAEIGRYTPETPSFMPKKTGYGFGGRDFGMLNALRIIEGEAQTTIPDIIVIETNLDDMTGEAAGYTLERLLSAGALDVFYTPIYMKKNRPALLLTVLSTADTLPALEDIILRETTTLGLRKHLASRTCMTRSFKTLKTELGTVTVKVCDCGNIHRETAEFEDIKRLAHQSGRAFQDVMALVNKKIYS